MTYKYNDDKINNIDEIQDIALDIYGKYDLEKSMLWMTEEFGEFIKAVRKEGKDNITEEIGDLLAWIFCLGNILEINLSDAIKSTFNKEIGRQIKTYHHMKYCDTIQGLEIME